MQHRIFLFGEVIFPPNIIRCPSIKGGDGDAFQLLSSPPQNILLTALSTLHLNINLAHSAKTAKVDNIQSC